MSFPRAAIKRFNERADTTIPPPGAYDPKFSTDVANSSSIKVGEKPSKGIAGKARSPEDNEPSASPSVRISRSPSVTSRRSRSSLVASADSPDAGKRDYSHNKAQPSSSNSKCPLLTKPRSVNKLTQVKTSPSGPSQSVSASIQVQNLNPITPLKAIRVITKPSEEQNPKDDLHRDDNPPPNNNAVAVTHDTNIPETFASTSTEPAMECGNVIEEIQDMAQSLQVEISEYKRRLGQEIIRGNELDARRIELDYVVNSLKRELKKYESAKHGWETEETSYKEKLRESTLEREILERQLSDLQEDCRRHEESKQKLEEKVAQLEEEKLQWEKEKIGCDVALQKLQQTLNEEERKRSKSEERCKSLTEQMDSCYHMCEKRTADSENIKEFYEVRVHELTEEKESLQNELDELRRELETEKTVLQLMTRSEKEKRGENSDTKPTSDRSYIC